MIILQQAFYGREANSGYKILGTSENKHTSIIEKICSSIGTPDGIIKVNPFYINYIDGAERYMIRACIGNPDNAGRKTLFFHIFIGNHNDLRLANVGIGLLIKQKAFLSTYEANKTVLSFELDERVYNIPWGNAEFSWNNEKLAILSDKEELSLLTGVLKNKINETSWASLSFRPLDFVTIYILSKYSPIMPNDRKYVDVNGRGLGAMDNNKKDSFEAHANNQLRSTPPINSRKSKLILYLFLLSVIGNIITGYLLYQQKGQCEAKEVVSVEIKEVIKEIPAKNAITREQLIEQLRNDFLSKYKPLQGSWDNAMQNDKSLKIQYDKHKKEPLIKAKGYIDFVNENILNNNNKQ